MIAIQFCCRAFPWSADNTLFCMGSLQVGKNLLRASSFMRSRPDSATLLRSFMQSMSLRKASVGIAARVDIIRGSARNLRGVKEKARRVATLEKAPKGLAKERRVRKAMARKASLRPKPKEAKAKGKSKGQKGRAVEDESGEQVMSMTSVSPHSLRAIDDPGTRSIEPNLNASKPNRLSIWRGEVAKLRQSNSSRINHYTWLIDSGATCRILSVNATECYEIVKHHEGPPPRLMDASDNEMSTISLVDVKVKFGKLGPVVLQNVIICDIGFNVLSPWQASLRGWGCWLSGGNDSCLTKETAKGSLWVPLAKEARSWWLLAQSGTRRKKAAEPQAMEVDRAKDSEEIPQGTTTSTATKDLMAPCGDGKKKNKKKKGFREDCPSYAAHSLEVTPFKFLLRRVVSDNVFEEPAGSFSKACEHEHELLHDGSGVRKQIRTKQVCQPVELVGSEMQSVCAAVVGKEVGLEGRCSLSAGLEGRYLTVLVPTLLLCLLLGASAAGTSVFGVSLKFWTSGSLLEDCFVSLQSEMLPSLPWRAVCCTFVGLTVLCCSVGKLSCTVGERLCTVGKLSCTVGEHFCTVGKLSCTVGEHFCTVGKLSCAVGEQFWMLGKLLLFQQPQTCGTFAVAVVREQRKHSCKPRGQPCRPLLVPEGHGGRLKLVLLCLLVLSCHGHFLRRGSVSLGHVETRSTRATSGLHQLWLDTSWRAAMQDRNRMPHAR